MPVQTTSPSSLPFQAVVEQPVPVEKGLFIPSPLREEDDENVEVIKVDAQEVDLRIQREQAHSLRDKMGQKVVRAV